MYCDNNGQADLIVIFLALKSLNALGLAALPTITGLNLCPLTVAPKSPVILALIGFFAQISSFLITYDLCGRFILKFTFIKINTICLNVTTIHT